MRVRALSLWCAPSSAPAMTAQGAVADDQCTVQPGDSLWSIAGERRIRVRPCRGNRSLQRQCPAGRIHACGAASLRRGDPQSGSARRTSRGCRAGMGGDARGVASRAGIRPLPARSRLRLPDMFTAGRAVACVSDRRRAPRGTPGTSAHELGTAVDLATPEDADVVDLIGARFGWEKVEPPIEWWTSITSAKGDLPRPTYRSAARRHSRLRRPGAERTFHGPGRSPTLRVRNRVLVPHRSSQVAATAAAAALIDVR